MTVDLHDQAPPNAEAFMMAWLMPLAGAPNKIGPKRWASGMPMPYFMVRRITGGTDLITDTPLMRVHTFAASYTEASNKAWDAHRRVLMLAEDPLLDVVMPDGSTANCEWLDADTEGPHEEPYGAESVVTRFVAEYRLGLHFGPIPA